MRRDEAERSLAVAVPLTLSGGFLDAFTYVGHGHVFANSMTGNVALLGISAASKDWAQALRHVPPLVAFVLAILASAALQARSGNGWLRHPAIATLCLELAFVTAAASHLVDVNDAWLIPGISFTATMQTMAFTHLENLTYTSVMTTGNLRRCMQQLVAGLVPRRDPGALHDAWLLGVVSASFLVGATAGAFMTRRWGDLPLFAVSALLLFALGAVFKGSPVRQGHGVKASRAGCSTGQRIESSRARTARANWWIPRGGLSSGTGQNPSPSM
jgi:uncharacterized membrane protein YoaK (UPF0700 family)